jgi:hypothetical protein
MLACALLDEGEGVSGFSSKVNYLKIRAMGSEGRVKPAPK